jgi:CrcB protein
LIVNLAGAALLGWVLVRAPQWRRLIGTGFCGALTTFSTFQVETIGLARDGHELLAFSYATASMAAGMAVAVAATVAVRRHRYG